ncbi:MAG: hypothetical protein GY870_22020 [archaeon]|nr:hypothetical protein [archaeon]
MAFYGSRSNVSNKLINALLDAMYDVLEDGRQSIVLYANLDYMNQKLPFDEETPFKDFVKLIDSMNYLLASSEKVLNEIGKKFAFYLSPFGTKIKDFVEALENNLSNLIKLDIEYPNPEKIRVVINNCCFCPDSDSLLPKSIYEDLNCQFVQGMIFETITKAISNNISVEVKHTGRMSAECKFMVMKKKGVLEKMHLRPKKKWEQE